ncbi:MAG: sensor histidine kinase [Flavobacteriales bacterium]
MIIDQYIHPKLKSDANTFRRARFMIMYVTIAGSLALLMGIYNFFVIGINANTIVLLTALIFSGLVILVVKNSGDLDIPAFLLCAVVWAASVTSAWRTGGIHSMDLQAVINVPVAAYIFKGRKVGFYWLVVILLTFLGFYLLDYFSAYDYSLDLEQTSSEGYYMKRLMFILNIAALVLFYEYSMKKQTQELIERTNMEKVRQQIARDFHDEMGNKLAAITLNSNLLSLSNTTDEKTKDILGKIEITSKVLYQSSRDFIWAIDTKSDDLSEVFDYLKDFGEDFYQSLHINFYTTTQPETLPKLILPPYFGRHIIMLFKEAMTNAAKYSNCKRVDLSIGIRDNFVFIEVKDDGDGFDRSTIKKGKGLNNMQHRATQMQGDFNIISEIKRGTQIQLKISV